ncbi:MAG: acyltransferase family protein [Flavisolibacter sp.]
MRAFLQKFRRITYSTAYLPEIDGLRFLAIFSVVVILHITHYLDEKFYGGTLVPGGYWKNFVLEGGSGVALFFVISGFILSLPFARWRLLNGEPVKLGNYFLRRLTRLEPPYIIALIILFIGHVWVLRQFSFEELFPHFLASLIYLHCFIYDSVPWVLPVAWSLEVEVQFYILGPIFFLVFLIRSRWVRWVLLVLAILLNSFYWFGHWGEVHLLVYLHHFLMGILLADLYTCRVPLFKNKALGLVIGIISLSGFLFIPTINSGIGIALKMTCMFLLVHTVLMNEGMKKMFTLNAFVIIGGMCYSIYLLHYAIVSALGFALLPLGKSYNTWQVIPLALLMALAVLLISSLYFLWVEKPFMKKLGLKRFKKT